MPEPTVAPRPLRSRWVPAPRDDHRIGFLRRASRPRSHEVYSGAPSTSVAKGARYGGGPEETITVRHDTRSPLRSHRMVTSEVHHTTPTTGPAKHKHSRDGGPAGGLPGLRDAVPTPRRSDRGPALGCLCVWYVLYYVFKLSPASGLLAYWPPGRPARPEPTMYGKGSEFRLDR